MKLTLESIYLDKDKYYSVAYRLLSEREIHETISHNDMPTWSQHVNFIESMPYKGWFITLADEGAGNVPVGSVYLSFQNEIGISIFRNHRRMGYAQAAIVNIMHMFPHEKYYLANINPANEKSIALFAEKLGFKLIQHTYKLMVNNNALP